jgi:glycerophosphoryl diester phosphodiesterase
VSGVRVIAHRGASAECPENTLAAFDEALRQGCDGIELDVQLSRDDVPVIYHDRTLAKAGGGRRRVHSLDAAELRRLDAGAWLDKRFAGQHIPTLDEVLARYGRRTRLLVEIKARSGRFHDGARNLRLARAVATRIKKMKLQTRAMVLCFDPAVLRCCAETAPGVRRVLNLRPPRTMTKTVRGVLPLVHALSADIRSLTPRFAAEARDEGCPVVTYTCNTPRRVDRALDAGVTGIMSDRPGWLREQLGREGRRA